MKKILTIIILSILISAPAQAGFLCKDIGKDGAYPEIKTFYKCREESTINFFTW
jgi:uncharacterized protein YxeA